MNRPVKSMLVLGFGNPGRSDDNLGPAAVEFVESLDHPGITVDVNYQLTIEDAVSVSEHEGVVFVDASKDVQAPFTFSEVTPSPRNGFTDHSLSPEAVLHISAEHFDAKPPAWVLAIRGYEFDLGEQMSDQAQQNLEEAVAFMKVFITDWRNSDHGRA